MIVIDTDPGLDDAVAILYALGAGLPVAAITTVAGNIGLDVTTRNAGRLLALAGRGDIPVHPGAAAPLAGAGLNEAAIHGADGLGGVALPPPAAPPSPVDAARAMAAILTAAPAGTVQIHALGPLTNIALLLRDHPAAAARVGRIIAMGGAIDEPGNAGPMLEGRQRAEFNLAHDPQAARAVIGAGLPLVLIPLDVTRRLRAGAAWLDGLTGTPAAEAARALIAAYFATRTEAVSRPLHDPCVPLMAQAPELFGLRTMHLAVDDSGALIAGASAVQVAMTLPDPEAALHRLAAGLTARP